MDPRCRGACALSLLSLLSPSKRPPQSRRRGIERGSRKGLQVDENGRQRRAIARTHALVFFFSQGADDDDDDDARLFALFLCDALTSRRPCVACARLCSPEPSLVRLAWSG